MEPSPADIVGKFGSIIKKIAPFVGAAHAVLGDPVSDGRGLQGAPGFIMERLLENPLWHDNGSGLHIANPLTTTMLALGWPNKYPIIPGCVAWLTGWLLRYAGKAIDAGRLGTTISSIGGAMEGYGGAAALVSIPAAWIYLAKYNESSGPDFTQGSGFSSGRTQSKPGSTTTYWQVRGGAHIRNATAAADVYPT